MRKWSNAEILEMIDRMRARRNGFRISPETAPLVIEALDRLASEFTPTDRPAVSSNGPTRSRWWRVPSDDKDG